MVSVNQYLSINGTRMIDLKLLDECRIDCDKCEHFNLCSSLIGENVALLGI